LSHSIFQLICLFLVFLNIAWSFLPFCPVP
jgi:hypothetical protein